MRKLTYLLPAILITGCSVADQLPTNYHTNSAHSGYYDPACQAGSCAPGQSYSVADYGQNTQDSYQNHYEHAPNGYAQNGYPQAPVPAYAPQAGYGYGAGYGAHNIPALRGSNYRKPGHFYGTLGGVLYDTDIDSYGIEGRIGYNSGRILGAEVEGSFGIIDDTRTITAVDLETGVDYNIAAFALARLPISQRLSLHARGGYDFRKLSASGTDAMGMTQELDLNLDGFAYGFGGEYAISPRDGLRLDFTRYDNELGALESVSASYVRKF